MSDLSDTAVQDCMPTVSDVDIAPCKPRDISEHDIALTETAEVSDGAALQPGVTIGPFLIEGLLTAGGMAEVYLARDDEGRAAALKVIGVVYARTKPVAVARLRCEAKALRHLDHDNIIKYLGAGTSAEGRPYLAMSYVEGLTLQQHLHAHGPMAPGEVARIAHALASALGETHDKAIIHRDIKPGNVLLDRVDGHVWLIDFGLARGLSRHGTSCPGCGLDTDRCASHGEVARTDRFAIAGTPAYMAPEQWEGAPASCAADVWALGLMMLEMLDSHPWDGLSQAELRQRVLSDKPLALLSQTERWLPAELATIVTCCLTHDPERRPTALELEQALRTYLQFGEYRDPRAGLRVTV